MATYPNSREYTEALAEARSAFKALEAAEDALACGQRHLMNCIKNGRAHRLAEAREWLTEDEAAYDRALVRVDAASSALAGLVLVQERYGEYGVDLAPSADGLLVERDADVWPFGWLAGVLVRGRGVLASAPPLG
jgi:hypothetical protein